MKKDGVIVTATSNKELQIIFQEFPTSLEDMMLLYVSDSLEKVNTGDIRYIADDIQNSFIVKTSLRLAEVI